MNSISQTTSLSVDDKKTCAIFKDFILWLYRSEALRLFFLAAVVLYTYGSFLTSALIGAADSAWYQQLLSDAITQSNHGFFPVYIGQSLNNFFGYPQIRAPLYILVGQLLHLLSFNLLSSIYLQHLIVFFNALFAAFLMYFFLMSIAPKLRWIAAILALIYVTCPGVIGLIYSMDMQYSFMAVPFVPLVIFSLIKSEQTTRISFFILVSVGLALLWLAHPPIALWLSGICVLFYSLCSIAQRKLKMLLGIIIIFLLLGLLNLWQFVAILNLGVSGGFKINPDVIYSVLKSDMPGVFLPLGWIKAGTTAFLQLGYTLWFIVGLGIFVAIKFKDTITLRILLACVFMLLLLLYPVPKLGYNLWFLVPSFIRSPTQIWPMHRFYMILAALLCFIGILAFDKFIAERKKTRIIIFMLPLLLWNIYQTHYFHVIANVPPIQTSPRFFLYDIVSNDYGNLFQGTYDPRIETWLLDYKGNKIKKYDNQQAMIEYYLENNKINDTHLPFEIKQTNEQKYPLQFLGVKAGTTGQKFFGLDISYVNVDGIDVEVFNSQYLSEQQIPLSGDKGRKYIVFPIYQAKTNDILSGYVMNVSGNGSLKINSCGLFSYDMKSLPIQLKSMTPYKAQVDVDRKNTFLEIFKAYFPGYQATVNGTVVPVLESRQHLVMIPIQKGINQITLNYRGTTWMRLSFYISAFTWLCLISFFVCSFFHKK